MVDVTQEDRDAAAAYYYSAGGSPTIAKQIRDGQKDQWFRVQAFARHRLAHPAPDGEVAWLYTHPDDPFPPCVRLIRHEQDDFVGMAKRGWTETPLFPHPPRNDAVVEALAVAAQELEACAPWMGDAAKGDILRAASHCRAQIAALKQGEA